MAKLDLNLDACRQMSVLLHRIRKGIRDDLRASQQGSADGAIPAPLRDYLEQRQGRETSIKWDLTESTDLLEYCGFADLYEILAANPCCLRRFSQLATDPGVLNIRFLELQTIQNRVSYARPVSEGDLGFLLGFEDRLKRSQSPQAEAVSPEPARPAAAPVEGATGGEASRPTPPKTDREVQPPAPSKEREASPASGQNEVTPKAEPSHPAPPAAEELAEPPVPRKAPPHAAPETVAAHPRAEQEPASVARTPLDGAIVSEDDDAILGILYREVTALADALSKASVVAMGTPAWESIRESAWYKKRFSKLGLRSVSDFYELVDKSRQLLSSGGSKSDLREYLRDHSFPKVVLALRDVFRAQSS